MSVPQVLSPLVHSQRSPHERYPASVSSLTPTTPMAPIYTVNPTDTVANLLLCHSGKLDLVDARGSFQGLAEAKAFSVNAQTYLTSGKVIEYVVTALPNLEEFTLGTRAPLNNNISDDDLLNLTKIQKITIKAASKITAEGLKALIEKCTNLVEFSTDLACFGDVHVKALVEKQKNLRVLTVTGKNRMSLDSLSRLSTVATNLTTVTTKFNDPLSETDRVRIQAQFDQKQIKWNRV